MRTRSSSHLIVESSTTLKRHNRRRSKQRVESFSLEETPVDTMADQRTMAELLQAPTEGYRDAIVTPAILSKFRNLRNKLFVSKVSDNTSFSTTACPSEIAALTDAVNAMIRHVKTSPSETVKAISKRCVTCGGPHPYYECLAADGNTFNASAAAATFNQNQGYHPQGDPNYRASNQMGPPGFPPVQNNQNCFNQNQGYNQNRGNNFNQEIVECLALADLGASINLMPLSIWQKLSLPNFTPISTDS
ncbi:hypothetical protein Tco_0689323 [Tanacetum coccineum]